MTRLALALALSLFCVACGSDNASPTTHGAHNDPADGKTKVDAAAPEASAAGQATGSGDYAASAARPGGVRTGADLGGAQTGTASTDAGAASGNAASATSAAAPGSSAASSTASRTPTP